MTDHINPPPRRRIRPVVARERTRVDVQPVAVPSPDTSDRYVGPSAEEFKNMTIRQRIEMLRQFDPETGEQLALDTVHQYMMARTSADVIAARMGYSVGWVVVQREKIRKRFKEQAENLDIRSYSMNMLDQLQEIAAAGMREAAAATPKEYARRMAGLHAARYAIQDQAKLLQLAGAYEMGPLRPTLTPQGEDDPAEALRTLARGFLSHVYEAKGIRPGDVIIDADEDDA